MRYVSRLARWVFCWPRYPRHLHRHPCSQVSLSSEQPYSSRLTSRFNLSWTSSMEGMYGQRRKKYPLNFSGHFCRIAENFVYKKQRNLACVCSVLACSEVIVFYGKLVKKTTERHLPYGITQVNAPRLNSRQTGRYSIYLPWRDGQAELTLGLVMYWGSLPFCRQSVIQVVSNSRSLDGNSNVLTVKLIEPL